MQLCVVITHSVLYNDSTLVKSKATITTTRREREREREEEERERQIERSILILGTCDISFTSWEIRLTVSSSKVSCCYTFEPISTSCVPSKRVYVYVCLYVYMCMCAVECTMHAGTNINFMLGIGHRVNMHVILVMCCIFLMLCTIILYILQLYMLSIPVIL